MMADCGPSLRLRSGWCPSCKADLMTKAKADPPSKKTRQRLENLFCGVIRVAIPIPYKLIGINNIFLATCEHIKSL